MAKLIGTIKRPRKLAISGTANQGKTTLISDIRSKWPDFIVPTKTYRDVIKEKGLVINKQGNKESQKVILDFLVEQVKENYGNKTVLFDRCPWDNLVYSLWLFAKGTSDIDEEFIEYSIDQVKDASRYLDIIFFIPITKHHKIEIVPDKLREVDPVYIEEVDHLFKAIWQDWKQKAGGFFKKEDTAAIIEVFGPRDVRMEMIGMYIDEQGNFFGEDQSMLKDVDLSMFGEVPDAKVREAEIEKDEIMKHFVEPAKTKTDKNTK